MKMEGKLKKLRGWFPQEPIYQTQVEKKDQVSIRAAFIVYCATGCSIVFPVLLLMDFLGVNFVFRTLMGAAVAGLAAAVANLLIKKHWKKTS
jgi:hypothetical protein